MLVFFPLMMLLASSKNPFCLIVVPYYYNCQGTLEAEVMPVILQWTRCSSIVITSCSVLSKWLQSAFGVQSFGLNNLNSSICFHSFGKEVQSHLTIMIGLWQSLLALNGLMRTWERTLKSAMRMVTVLPLNTQVSVAHYCDKLAIILVILNWSD